MDKNLGHSENENQDTKDNQEQLTSDNQEQPTNDTQEQLDNQEQQSDTANQELDTKNQDTFAFNWEWQEDSTPTQTMQQTPPPKKTKPKTKKPIIIFGIVMIVVFVVALSLLGVALISDLTDVPENNNSGDNDVSIDVSDLGPTSQDSGTASPQSLEEFNHSVVVIQAHTGSGAGTGSGIIMDTNGYIATNYHVIEGSDKIEVILYDGRIFEAQVVGHSEMDDLAVLKINAKNLVRATFGKDEDVGLGQTVYAVGSPAGLEFAWTTSKGSVTFVDREISIYNDFGMLEKKMNVIQTDTSVNPGNSGGPLINSRCEVIGIVTMKLSDGYDGMGFAIPIDGALEILLHIIEHGDIDDMDSSVSTGRPLLGITGVGVTEDTWYESVDDSIRPVTEEYAKENPDTTFYAEHTGVLVNALTPGFDAEVKLQVDDIITKIEGEAVQNIYDVMGIINTFDGGDSIDVTVYRDGEYVDTEIILGTAE